MMIDELNKIKLNKIFNHFGYDNQLKKLNEEFFEVTEALVLKDRAKFVEEISDVLVVALQFKQYYKVKDDEIINAAIPKINRTTDIIDEVV